MARDDYKRSLELAKTELGELITEKENLTSRLAEIDKQIAEMREGIKGLAKLCDQQITKELTSGNKNPLAGIKSLNDAVRFALKVSRDALTPVQVRDKLISLGYDTTKYKSDFLATLHTVLKRLDRIHHEVEVVHLQHGKTGYKWITETDKLGKDNLK